MKSKVVDYFVLIAVAAIWGVNFGVSRLAMDTFDPILFVFLRFGLAIPFFFLLLKIKEGNVGIPFKTAIQLLFLGLIGVTALEILVMYSIKYTTLANASLLNVAPWPIFTALFAPLFTREKTTVHLLIGGFIAIGGVSLVILGGTEGFNLSSEHMLGNLLAFSVSIIGALYNLASMPLMNTFSALRVSTWSIFFGTLFLFPFTVDSWGKVDWTYLGAMETVSLIYNVLFCTVLAFIGWNASMYRVGATRSNFFRYGVPASAVITGFVMFQETITVTQIVGAGLMALGLIWISTEKKTEKVVPELTSI